MLSPPIFAINKQHGINELRAQGRLVAGEKKNYLYHMQLNESCLHVTLKLISIEKISEINRAITESIN